MQVSESSWTMGCSRDGFMGTVWTELFTVHQGRSKEVEGTPGHVSGYCALSGFFEVQRQMISPKDMHGCQPWANYHVSINRLFLFIVSISSSFLVFTTFSQLWAEHPPEIAWSSYRPQLLLLCQSPSTGEVRAAPACLCLVASCPTCFCNSQLPATGTWHVWPCLSSQLASSSTVGA